MTQIRNVTVHLGGDAVVDDVSLDLFAGGVTVLVGPSGCGKTTLLRAVAGLQSIDGGSIDVDRSPGRIGFVFQQPALLPWRTARDNVAWPSVTLGRDRTDAAERAQRWLARVQLADAAHKYPRKLSGGMRMRVSLARALSTDPSLLLLDEPLAALDEALRLELGGLLRSIVDEGGVTAFMVTHNLDEAVTLSDRVAVMRGGRIVDVVDQPAGERGGAGGRLSAEGVTLRNRLADSLLGDAA